MKKEKHIVTTLFLLLLLCGCIKKETELITNNSQVEYTEITEAYLGESKELTIKGDNDLFVKLYIDGQEVAKDVNGNIRYNLSSLALGSHSIKVECYVGDEWFEKSWTCKIVEMPVVEEYDYVDLGLPSGTLWATCNVGAKNPWDYGDYFAWGETEPKEDYRWETYKYVINGDFNKFTKYCNNSDDGNNGFTDNLTVLLPEDDAATANWGSDWRMPTQAEFQELYDNSDWEWTSNYNGTGVSGIIVKSRNNANSLFLPAAGYRYGTDLLNAGSEGDYWSSSLNFPTRGRFLDFDSGGVHLGAWCSRNNGQTVRAVRCR